MSAYHALANAFFAVGGFILAGFAMFGVLCLASRLYLSFIAFVAEKFAEDAGAHWSYGDHPALPRELTNPECVDALHRSGDTL
jgi:hypothetical protein